jgi:hypothetical protein
LEEAEQMKKRFKADAKHSVRVGCRDVSKHLKKSDSVGRKTRMTDKPSTTDETPSPMKREDFLQQLTLKKTRRSQETLKLNFLFL